MGFGSQINQLPQEPVVKDLQLKSSLQLHRTGELGGDKGFGMKSLDRGWLSCLYLHYGVKVTIISSCMIRASICLEFNICKKTKVIKIKQMRCSLHVHQYL
jgi:hypothetical protein